MGQQYERENCAGSSNCPTTPVFQKKWRQVKRDNKADLAGLIKERTGITVDPDSLFDIQVKRLHEYKRQHLNVLHIVTLYNRLKKNPSAEITPANLHFRGQSCSRLLHGKAYYQAHQLGGRGGERRS